MLDIAGFVTSPTLLANWMLRGGIDYVEVYDKAALVDPTRSREEDLVRVVEMDPGITAAPALDTTGVVWSRERTVLCVDFWVQREAL